MSPTAERASFAAVIARCDCAAGHICGSEPLTCTGRWPPLRPLTWSLPAIYRCAECRRWFPWCHGAADDRTELCDDCWSRAEVEAGKGRE